MAQLLVRNIPDDVMADFKARASSEGMAAEALARIVIANESKRPSRAEAIRRMDALRALSPPLPPGSPSSVELLRQIRDGNDDGH